MRSCCDCSFTSPNGRRGFWCLNLRSAQQKICLSSLTEKMDLWFYTHMKWSALRKKKQKSVINKFFARKYRKLTKNTTNWMKMSHYMSKMHKRKLKRLKIIEQVPGKQISLRLRLRKESECYGSETNCLVNKSEVHSAISWAVAWTSIQW